MSEPTDHEHETDDLTPEQDAAVRRALADVGDAGPMPADVADRLDGVLVTLAAERAAVPTMSHPEDHHVVPLDAAARRRRFRARALVAAAAVVIAGAVGAGLLSDQGGNDPSAADEMAQGDPDRSAALDEAPPSAVPTSEAGGGAEATSAAPTTAREMVPDLQRLVADGPLREVRADHLSEDLVALQQLTLRDPGAADYDGTTLTAPDDFVCEPAAFGPGHLIGVEYAGKPAVVAFREPVGQTQAADVLACGTGDVLHSTTLKTTG